MIRAGKKIKVKFYPMTGRKKYTTVIKMTG
jgi:hypothetical protein